MRTRRRRSQSCRVIELISTTAAKRAATLFNLGEVGKIALAGDEDDDIPRELAEAIEKGDAAEFKRLLSMSPTLLRRHNGNCGWLFAAVQCGQLEVLKFLVSEGVDVNEQDANLGDRPILMAASEGHLDVVRYLLDQGAKINEVKPDGSRWCSTLNGAVMGGRTEVVKLLVERGANINAIGPGMTPLSYAVDYGRDDIAEYLRSKGAKLPEELSPEERGPAKPAKDEKKKPKKK